jgi:hypothetical protein
MSRRAADPSPLNRNCRRHTIDDRSAGSTAMAASNTVLEINRAAHGTTRCIDAPLGALAPGHVRFEIERVAITANTVTYATTGDLLGYWDFYPSGDPAWGRVPAMGWARVAESNVAGIEPGGRCFGWFPMARFVDVQAAATPEGLRDEGAHRQAHAPVYRNFVDTRRDPFHQPGEDAEDRHALLRGLFITGWLAEDYFHDNQYFGANRVLVLSASSKTALGFAWCADRRAHLEVVAATSARNHRFVADVGCYDEVVDYESIASIPAGQDIVVIDMSGSGPLLGAVHGHFRDRLRHSMAIGRSHHDSPPRASDLPGPKPAFFFAPTQVKKRVQDWGPRGYQDRVAEALRGFVDGSAAWLRLERSSGADAAARVWHDVHANAVPPDVGHVVSLR